MKTITIEVPDDIFAALRCSPEEFARELRLAGAILSYGQGIISQDKKLSENAVSDTGSPRKQGSSDRSRIVSKAASIVGLDRTDFLFALAHAKVDAFQISAEDPKGEVEFGLQARRERLAAHLPDESGAP